MAKRRGKGTKIVGGHKHMGGKKRGRKGGKRKGGKKRR